MDRDEFIITVYCLVCEHYRAITDRYPLRRGGFEPALSDEAVLTMEICGVYCKLSTAKDIFAYFRSHYAHFFPRLTERALFVRQAANRWQVKAAIPRRLTHLSGQAVDPIQIIDPLPLPVCGYTAVDGIAVSSPWPTMVTVRLRSWITTGSSWACVSPARG